MRKSILAFAILAVLGIPMAATADTIDGTMNVSGTIEISNGGIAFSGPLSLGAMQQGGFTALAGTTGTIQNFTAANAPGVIFPTPNFITLSGAPNINFTLLELKAGVDGAAECTANPPSAGQVCTPNLESPLNLQNLTATISAISFTILGNEVDSVTDETVPVIGIFTIQLANTNYQSVLATLAGDGTITSSFSAQITTGTASTPGVPEPGTLSMMAIGMLTIGTLGMVWSKRTGSTARYSTAS